jgi:TetR/AcrR family transcriptional regulator, cholesterol catabolism regulator
MKDVNDKILDVAIELAEEGGFENVRQRDVAKRAGVALGTLYKRFRSKEDILSAAIARQTEGLERRMRRRPIAGAKPEQRISTFFQQLTRAMCRKPQYARAVLRAMASGVPEIAENVTRYQEQMNRLTVSALRGSTDGDDAGPPTDTEAMLALMLQQVWFASLVGWSAGLHGQTTVVEHTETAAQLLLKATAYIPPDSTS